MARKYRKKPVVVEAIQWTGKNLQGMKNFVGDSLEYDVMDAAWEVGKGPVIVNVRIQTLEGIHHASVGDFIIKGIRGEFYPCKPDIFAKTYESATLTPTNEWVSVEERLPEESDGMVLFTNGRAVTSGYRNHMFRMSGEEGIYAPAIRKGGGYMRVTHWMLLPAPPEGEEDT